MNEYSPLTPPALQREQEMKFGAQVTANGVRFRLWAPASQAVSVKIEALRSITPMAPKARGWFEVEVPDARPGMTYRFVLENGLEVPDPASRFQPEDVHGPSEIIDPRSFGWTDAGWRGRPWDEIILYELHIGTFTPEGTFRAAIDKLDLLVELGITAIELMPIADFPGRWNWGYDGVHLFAPDSNYGRPEDLKALVDAAHARGICMFLDVVYNHFGPNGNYLTVYTPLTTDRHRTPWGEAINYDAEGSEVIRDFMFANARYWLTEFRFDGLRFDAVHEIKDSSPRHMLQDLAERLRAATDDRHIHLVVENSNNEAGWMKRRDSGEPWLYDAQWSDDIHHALHAAITGESFWYYADFAGRIDLVGRALAEGLAWQGEYLTHEGRAKGESSAFLPATAFVAYAQNHDQTGNRRHGERLSHIVSEERARLWAAIYLLSPQIPMVFMGEEWAAKQPFPFFSDVSDELADAIREGRRVELELQPHGASDRAITDPMAARTFQDSKLQWSDRDRDERQSFLLLYRRLIALRKEAIIPRLPGMAGHSGNYNILDNRVVRVHWTLGDGSVLTMTSNLSPDPFKGIDVSGTDQLWLEGSATGDTLEGWSVVFFAPGWKRSLIALRQPKPSIGRN